MQSISIRFSTVLFIAVYFAFHSNSFKIPILSRIGSKSLKLYQQVGILHEYIHSTEYPDDNFDHIFGVHEPNHQLSKLQQISADKIKEVITSKQHVDFQGCGIDRTFFVSSDDLVKEISDFDEVYGKPLNLRQKIQMRQPTMALAAEFKRSSPSKGDININIDVIEQCKQYAAMGASVISVLTESKYFKGSLEDMKKVRIALQQEYGAEQRPVILRKDFIFDR